MNIAQIISEAGAYYQDNGQSAKDILQRFRQRNETDQFFSDSNTTRDTLVRKANSNTTRVLQSFQKAFTPLGATTFQMEKIELFQMKVDLEETPDDLVDSWLGFLEGENEIDRKKWPFVRWWLEKEILPKIEEDYELYEVFKGVYAAPTSGTPGLQGKSMDGLNIIRKRHIAAGKIAPIVMGALPTTPLDAVNYVEDFVKQFPKLIWGKLEPLRMNQEFGQLYLDGVDEKYNVQYKQVSDKLTVKNTPVRIAAVTNEDGILIPGLRSMEGSEVLWTTVKGNSVLRVKNPVNAGLFQLESQTRQIRAFTDWWKGVGWWMPNYVLTNDRDTTIS